MSHFIIPLGAREYVNAILPVQAAADTTGLAMTQFYHPDYGWNGINALSDKWKDHKFVRQVKQTYGAVTWLPTSYFNF